MNLEDTGCEGLDRFHLSQNIDHIRAFVIKVMDLLVL